MRIQIIIGIGMMNPIQKQKPSQRFPSRLPNEPDRSDPSRSEIPVHEHELDQPGDDILEDDGDGRVAC